MSPQDGAENAPSGDSEPLSGSVKAVDIEEEPESSVRGDMSEMEQRLATDIYESMMRTMHESDRSKQAQEFVVGISDLGYCSERLRRFLDRQVPDEVDMLPAFHGTWLGEGIEQAFKAAHPEALIQQDITVTLVGDTGTFVIPGHPDIIWHNILLDAKSADGLEIPRRKGMEDQQKKFQRHAYAKGAHEAGLFGDIPLEEVMVGNVWIDRSARERTLLVKLEPYDPAVVEEATQWLDEVVYIYDRNEGKPPEEQDEAMKEPAREVCRKTCGFFVPCRGYDTDVEGLITDPDLLAAVDIQIEAADLTKRANRLKKEAKAALDDVAGSTGSYLVRWIEVGPVEVPAMIRSGYKRLQVTKIKEG